MYLVILKLSSRLRTFLFLSSIRDAVRDPPEKAATRIAKQIWSILAAKGKSSTFKPIYNQLWIGPTRTAVAGLLDWQCSAASSEFHIDLRQLDGVNWDAVQR